LSDNDGGDSDNNCGRRAYFSIVTGEAITFPVTELASLRIKTVPFE